MTTTLNFDVVTFPLMSVAVHVTVVVPIGNFDPDGGVQTSDLSGEFVSDALASYATTAPSLLVASAVIVTFGVVVLIAAPTLLYSNAPMSHASPAMPGRGAPR